MDEFGLLRWGGKSILDPGGSFPAWPAGFEVGAAEILQRHGLLAPLHTELPADRRAGLPVAVQEAALKEHRRTLRANLQVVAQAAWLFERWRGAGIDFLVFKGPVLAQDAWGHLGARTFGDIDLLVRTPEMAGVARFLRGEGFEGEELGLSYESVFLHHGRGLKVEPHTRFVSPSFLPRFDPAAAWPGCRRRLEGLGEVPTLTHEMHLVVLAVHAAKHLMEFFHPSSPVIRLGLYVEVARFVDRHPGLDWARVLADCARFRCRRAVLHVFACAVAWFDWRPPAVLAAELARAPGLERLTRCVTAGVGVSQAQLKRSPRQLARQARSVALLRDSWPEGLGLAVRYFIPPLCRRLTGRA